MNSWFPWIAWMGSTRIPLASNGRPGSGIMIRCFGMFNSVTRFRHVRGRTSVVREARRKGLNRLDIAMIPVMVGHKSYVEFSSQIRGSNGWRLDLPLRTQIEICADEDIIDLDEPTRISHPPDRDTLVMRANLFENCRRALRIADLRLLMPQDSR